MRRPTISTTAKEQLLKLFDLLVESYKEAPTMAHAIAGTAAWSEMFGAWILGANVVFDPPESYEEPAQRTVRFYDGPRHGQDEAYPTPLPPTIEVAVLLPGALELVGPGEPLGGVTIPARVEHYDFELDTGGFAIYRHRPDGDDSAAASMPKDSREEGATT